MLKNTVIFLILSLLMACNLFTNQKEPIAKVYDNVLYKNDIAFLFKNHKFTKEDSIKTAKSYIDSWIEEQSLVHYNDSITTVNLEEIKAKAEHYKNILIIQQLENNYITKNLDTNITENEIVTYYKSHKADFELNDYLVKVLYLKLPLDAPNINKVEKWYKLQNSKDSIEIEKYAQQYASNFYYDTENWIYFDELTKEIPLKDFNKDRFITRKSKTIIDENGYFYFLNIIDYKLKNTTSPLDFERDHIKKRIINIRVKKLKEKFKKEKIEKAKNEKAIKIY
jgi:hypothetical protein